MLQGGHPTSPLRRVAHCFRTLGRASDRLTSGRLVCMETHYEGHTRTGRQYRPPASAPPMEDDLDVPQQPLPMPPHLAARSGAPPHADAPLFSTPIQPRHIRYPSLTSRLTTGSPRLTPAQQGWRLQQTPSGHFDTLLLDVTEREPPSPHSSLRREPSDISSASTYCAHAQAADVSSASTIVPERSAPADVRLRYSDRQDATYSARLTQLEEELALSRHDFTKDISSLIADKVNLLNTVSEQANHIAILQAEFADLVVTVADLTNSVRTLLQRPAKQVPGTAQTPPLSGVSGINNVPQGGPVVSTVLPDGDPDSSLPTQPPPLPVGLKAPKIKKVELSQLPPRSSPGVDGGLLKDAYAWISWERLAKVELSQAGAYGAIKYLPPDEYAPHADYWQEMNAAAFHALLKAAPTSFHPELSQIASAPNSARRAWNILNAAYLKSGHFYFNSLQQELSHFAPKPRETMTTYLSRAQQVLQTFRRLKVPLEETTLIRAVFQGLQRADGTWQLLSRQINPLQTWNEAYHLLLEEDGVRLASYENHFSTYPPLGYPVGTKASAGVRTASPTEVSTPSAPATVAHSTADAAALEARLKQLEAATVAAQQRADKAAKDAAAAARYRPPGARRTTGFRPISEVICHKCNQSGHYANECPLLRRPGASGPGGQGSGNTAAPATSSAPNVPAPSAAHVQTAGEGQAPK